MALKWVPSITIYKVEIFDRKTGITIQEEYFFSMKWALKFIEKHFDELRKRGLSYNAGGHQLWLWS